jgi:hypothetical protein
MLEAAITLILGHVAQDFIDEITEESDMHFDPHSYLSQLMKQEFAIRTEMNHARSLGNRAELDSIESDLWNVRECVIEHCDHNGWPRPAEAQNW